MDAKTNEIPQTEELLTALVVAGRVFTMGALLTQKDIAQQIMDGGGDYVMLVKGNQPQLQEDSTTVLALGLAPDEQRQEAQTVAVGHGRIEQWELTSSYVLAGYTRGPACNRSFKWCGKQRKKRATKCGPKSCMA